MILNLPGINFAINVNDDLYHKYLDYMRGEEKAIELECTLEVQTVYVAKLHEIQDDPEAFKNFKCQSISEYAKEYGSDDFVDAAENFMRRYV